MGDLVVDTVGLLGDRLRFYRAERWILLSVKTKERLRRKGIKHIRTVPPKVALPLIEAATIEDDEDLHTLWANLLATGLDESAALIRQQHVATLSALSLEDAQTLRAIYLDWHRWKDKSFADPPTSPARFEGGVDGAGETHGEVSVIHLNRLGLIAPCWVEFEAVRQRNRGYPHEPVEFDDETVRVVGGLDVVNITAFGEAFCEAVDIRSLPGA
jgi:hypothetical protein